MNVLRVANIHKSYRQGGMFGRGKPSRVLSGVELALEKGECLGLVGRSGCGKSTLTRIVLGLEKPDAGTVFYKDRDIQSLKGRSWREYRRNVQVVFQNFIGAVNPRLRAGDIIAEPLRNFERMTRAALGRRVDGLLEMVGLAPEDAAKTPTQFSGGQLQRVCIARAMALSPEVLVLDEAVSSLDMLVQAQVMDLLATLGRERGLSCLFISHDLRVVARLCSKVAVLHGGRIVERAVCEKGQLGLCGKGFQELATALLPARPGAREADDPAGAAHRPPINA
jgi:nickel transport system ATP-binding protein